MGKALPHIKAEHEKIRKERDEMERGAYVKDREGTSYVALMTELYVTWYHYLVKELTTQGVKTNFDEMVLQYLPAVQKVPVNDVPAEEGRQ